MRAYAIGISNFVIYIVSISNAIFLFVDLEDAQRNLDVDDKDMMNINETVKPKRKKNRTFITPTSGSDFQLEPDAEEEDEEDDSNY